MATIACVGEDAGRCHVVPDRGTDVPTGASAMIPLPSAPKAPVHVQPTVGPMSINAPGLVAVDGQVSCCASDAGTLTETEPGSAAVVVVTPEVVWHTTTGSVAVTIGPEVGGRRAERGRGRGR